MNIKRGSRVEYVFGMNRVKKSSKFVMRSGDLLVMENGDRVQEYCVSWVERADQRSFDRQGPAVR